MRNLPQFRGIFLDELSRETIMAVIGNLPCSNSTKTAILH
nr:MAG TPA: hypothetical protein [Caudoviricetes sp.]